MGAHDCCWVTNREAWAVLRDSTALLFLLSLLGTLANKLNAPQVLLPFGQEPGSVPFLLEAQRLLHSGEGCRDWPRVCTPTPPRKNGKGSLNGRRRHRNTLWSFIPVVSACRDQGGVSAGMEGQPF